MTGFELKAPDFLSTNQCKYTSLVSASAKVNELSLKEASFPAPFIVMARLPSVISVESPQ